MKHILITSLISILPLFGFTQPHEPAVGRAVQVGMTVEQFNLKLKTTTKPLLVNFTAEWCVVCKRQKPILDLVMEEVKDQVELLIINMDTNPLIAAYFEVDGLPVMILYKDGAMIWDRVGFLDRVEILEQVAPYLNKKVYWNE